MSPLILTAVLQGSNFTGDKSEAQHLNNFTNFRHLMNDYVEIQTHFGLNLLSAFSAVPRYLHDINFRKPKYIRKQMS